MKRAVMTGLIIGCAGALLVFDAVAVTVGISLAAGYVRHDSQPSDDFGGDYKSAQPFCSHARQWRKTGA